MNNTTQEFNQFFQHIRQTLEETRREIRAIENRDIERRLAEVEPYRSACQRIMNPENYN